MDNSWRIKFDSTSQSSMPSMASSASQEPRNQMEMNSDQYFHQHATQDLSSTLHERMHDPMPPNYSNLFSHKSNHSELENSFLALLSGPPSLLQCDFQELSSRKVFNASRSVNFNDFGSEIPRTSGALLSENLSNQNRENGANCSAAPSRLVLSSTSSVVSVLHGNLHASNLNLQTSDLVKVVNHHVLPGTEKVKDFATLKGDCYGTSSAKAGNPHSKNIQMSQKIHEESNSSISDQSSTILSGCPRVSCLGAGGYLLLSNTGLLGIVCSCHFFHTSVSKFCEHSGLVDMNPGDAVRMESGETIAQWRKLFFEKFGIRVPEDRSGWDWPEGLLPTTGLVKSSATMPKISNTHLANPVGSSQGFSRCMDNTMFPRNPHTGQNSATGLLHNKQVRKNEGSSNFLLKHLVGASKSNLHDVADGQRMECAVSKSSIMSTVIGRDSDNGCQSMSAWIDSISKTGNSSLIHSSLQNLRTLGQNYDESAAKITDDGVISDRDAASSNVELKLGQPYQPTQPIGNYALPVVAPKHFNAVLGPPKSCYPEQMVNLATFYGEEESRQYCHHDADSSNPTARGQWSQLNLGNHALAVSSLVDATKLESRGDAAKSLVVPLLPELPLEGSACSRGTGNMVSEFSMPKIFHCGSNTTKCDPLNAPLKIGNNLGRQLNMPELGFCRSIEKGKGAGLGCVSGGFSAATDSAFHKQVQNPRIVTGVVPGFSAVHGTDSCQSSDIPSGRFDERSCLKLPGNASFGGNSGHTDQAFLRMMSSYLGSRHISQSSAVSMGFPLATSTFLPGSTSTISQQEVPCLLDDSMRLLALRQILELSKQHAISSVGMSNELGRLDRTSNPNLQHSLLESSKSREERHGSILLSRQDVFEGASASVPFPAAEKSTPVTGLDNFSTLTQGLSLHSREIDLPCQFSNELFPNQSALRLIRGENIMRSSGHATCCQRVPCTYFQGDCICSAHAKCSEGYSECRVGRSHVVSKQQVDFCCEAPMPVASEFVRDHIIPKERTILLNQGGKVNGKPPMRIACHTSQWRDVPSKQKKACKITCISSSAEMLDASGCAEYQHGDAAGMHGIESAVNRADSFKGQDMSNVSSGCSAPAVTQASIEVNNMDSSTIDAGDNGYIDGLIVDEGSGIDKCCSSNDALESERSAEFLGVSCTNKIRNKGSAKILNGQSSFSLLDELKLIDSLTWKKGQNQIYMSLTGSGRTNHLKKIRRGSKAGKRKRGVKVRMLDVSFPPKVSFRHCYNDNDGSPRFPSRSSKDQHTLIQSGLEPPGPTQLIQPGELASAKIVSRKRDLCGVSNDQDAEVYQPELKGDARFSKILEVSGRKKLKRAWAYDSFENLGAPKPLRTVEKTSNSNSVHCIKAFSSLEVSVCDKKARPIVYGEYGEICSGKFDTDELRPAKIVPLRKILKNTEQRTLRKSCKPKSTLRMLKKKRTARSTAYFDLSSDLKKEEENGGHHVSFLHEVGGCLVEEGKKTGLGGIKQFDNKSFILEKGKAGRSEKNCCIPDAIAYNRSNTRCKEIRKRSLYELTGKGKESSFDSYPLMEISKCMPKMKVRKGSKKAGDVECHGHGSCNINAEKSIKELRCSSCADSDVFCCVCGSSNKDEFNCLLECSQCSVRVHQACYGISTVPKGHWYCRPCRTSSKDIVCVLCGYGGGAMTRALRSRAFVKDLLKAWNIEAECRPKSTSYSAETMLDNQSLVVGNEFCNLQCKDHGLSRTAMSKMDVQNDLNIIQNSPCPLSKLNVYNSVTAGVLDSAVKQWVHMVCGLWTPGTRCPNVDTMSAFDVSGVSHARENVVCSICNRPGGSCIRCRVVDCSVRFHPWCAHQKGLLQSEVEGVDNENVGFYGRCMLHASQSSCESGSDPTDAELSFPRKGESTCARTEGFKGRKRDGFWHNIYGQSRRKNGCFVPQEQLNAWVHINGQKSCMQGLPKLPTSDIEYDCRKEYARYKQAKGWKHLVVYKSGIHALGLYTSRFISRGEMVVEYVGEIVGLRVADKRENEYQSGRKVQYKSACYFFRIDKEHIIDATRKGGIARFVNHSCLPNCVAKVISVRNEKKVVFFAERDIYPGEEVTYDYHFNHEDEGKKIPCFCNSKNCRRYLN